jgi:hypothetical protein
MQNTKHGMSAGGLGCCNWGGAAARGRREGDRSTPNLSTLCTPVAATGATREVFKGEVRHRRLR